MKKTIAAVVTVFLLSVGAYANITYLDIPAVSAPVAVSTSILPSPTMRLVPVSGYVTLMGNGWIPGNTGGYTSINLSGWGTFANATGRITSSNTYINVSMATWVYPNKPIREIAWPQVNVQFYRAGQLVGSAILSGSISVSGWPSGSFFTVQGSGQLTGAVYVTEEQ